MHNKISFRLWGKYALFTDPITKVGGEKFTYQLPTYEAIKGVLKSIYWKPTLIWHIDKVRIVKPIRTQNKGIKPLNTKNKKSTHTLSFYTFLHEVEYQVEAHFTWNLNRPELEQDRNWQKHSHMAQRALAKGGRQDIFLGVRDCQAYVEPCEFGSGTGAFDDLDELSFGLMFHGFDYPDETGVNELQARFWQPVMQHGVVHFPKPEAFLTSNQGLMRRFVRPMNPKQFTLSQNCQPIEATENDR
jgi:CRISPR-associated protein Cas5d